jgi:acyl-CoA synthetase (AMP-forming)/AMP-acid ligase II
MVSQHPSAYDEDRPALILADRQESISYRELTKRANQCARLYQDLGCDVGDTIAILSENAIFYPELCWAAKNSGLHYACISTHLTVGEIIYIVQNSGARVLVVSAALAGHCHEIAKHCPAVAIVTVGVELPPYPDYLRLRDRFPDEAIPDRPRGASMLYSSGTTGFPKGVRADLDDEPATTPPVRLAALVNQYHFDRDTVFVNPGPFYHTAPLRFMMSVHRLGGTVIGFSRFDPEVVLKAIEGYRATHGFFVPTMFVRFLELELDIKGRTDVSSMRYAIHGAAPCSIPVKEAMINWWGPVVYELYGGTEGCGQTFISPQEWLQKKGSVGKAPPGCTLRILDENNQDCAPFENGRIYMGNGRRFSYHKDEEKTGQVTGPDGLVTMGDVGYLDKDGYLYLTDRETDLIITGGVNVYPREVERVIEQLGFIREVAVLGVPDRVYGETVVAIVILEVDGDSSRSEESARQEIAAYCQSRLSGIKCPRRIEFWSSLPRTETGKILKRRIKDQLNVS